MSNVKKTVQLYQKLFSLPSSAGVTGLSFVAIISNIVILWYLFKIEFISSVIVVGVLWFCVSLLPLILLKARVLTTRRSLGLGSLSLLLFAAITSIGGVLSFSWPTLAPAYLGLYFGVLFFFLNIILNSICYNRTTRIGFYFIVFFIFCGLLIFLDPSLIFDLNMIRNLLITPLLFYLGSFFFLWIIDTPAKAVLGIGGISLFQGFVDEWLEGDSQILDDIFTRIGTRETIRIQSLEFKSEGQSCYVVVPEIHPGPFKSIGSSTLSLALRKRLGKNVFITHSASTHDLNLVSKKETERIMDLFVEGLNTLPAKTSRTCTKFIASSFDSMVSSGQLFGNIGFFFASNRGNHLDDIDRTVAEFARRLAKNKGLSDILLIDAHHGVEGMCEPLMPFTSACDSLLAAIDSVVGTGQAQNQYPFEFGVAHRYPPPFGLEDGFGPAGISSLVIQIGDEVICYLSIDANNLVVGLREQIEASLKGHFAISHVEIVTTDTHMVSGLDTHGMGFNPLGEKLSAEEITPLCNSVVGESLATIRPGMVLYRELKIDDALILGRENMDAFTTLISGSAKLAKSVSFSLMGLLFIVSLLNLLSLMS
ncbi:MAG: DUF2070 family protein [Candidatus Ranarchaeia archaeon]